MSPKKKERNKEIRDRRRTEILDAALHVFAEAGYHSSSVSSVAKRAKISKGLIYNYFESKEEILHALIMSALEDYLPQMGLPENPDDFDDKAFKFNVELGIDIVLKNLQNWKLYFSIFVQPDVMAMMMPKIMEYASPLLKIYAAYFTRKGWEDPIAVMRYFSACLDGVQLHIMLDPENFPVEQVKKIMIKQFTENLTE